MTKRSVLQPEYMKHFSCIGSECEDTCCSGWQIIVDEITYKKYEFSTLEMTESILAHLKKNESKPTSEHYAEIVLNEHAFCPLLNQEKLCSVHTELGEEYLSNLCTTYPRVSNIINGKYERSATLSCPEAARLALLNQSGIIFEEVEESIEERHFISRKLVANSGELYDVREVRKFLISLLQNREYSIEERLINVGNAIEELKKGIDKGNEIDANFLCTTNKVIRISGMEEDPKSTQDRLILLRKLIDMHLFTGAIDKRYLNCVMEALRGLKFTSSALKEESVYLYNQSIKQYYEPFLETHSYVLENYLVNYVFKNIFDFQIGRRLSKEFRKLITHFALIKFLLVGMLNFHKEYFSEGHIITLIQSFGRNLEHNYEQKKAMDKYLSEHGYSTMTEINNLIVS